MKLIQDLGVVNVLLRESYQDATRKGGLGEFTKEVRGPDNNMSGKWGVTANRLNSLFSSDVWQESKMGSGHRKFKHVITGVTIGYSSHDNAGGIDPGAVEDIFKQVQKHLNILGNTIFGYTTRNWKSEPNYMESAQRFIKLQPILHQNQ